MFSIYFCSAKNKIMMKPVHAFLVFAILCLSSVAAGIDSLWRTQFRAQQSVDYALEQTLHRCHPDQIDADTIRVYRSLITMAALRDTAYLSVSLVETDKSRQPMLQAHTGLSFADLWILSDQRASCTLASLAALWLLVSLWLVRRQPERCRNLIALGLLSYDSANGHFYVHNEEVHFTPMQQTLMQLFFLTPDHTLSHQDICDRLWPKKPDASATLYTLIRRLKPILKETANLSIECNRGESYQLCL